MASSASVNRKVKVMSERGFSNVNWLGLSVVKVEPRPVGPEGHPCVLKEMIGRPSVY